MAGSLKTYRTRHSIPIALGKWRDYLDKVKMFMFFSWISQKLLMR